MSTALVVLVLLIVVGAGSGGCAVRSGSRTQATGVSGGNTPVAWPPRAGDARAPRVTGGSAATSFVDLGRRGEGRLYRIDVSREGVEATGIWSLAWTMGGSTVTWTAKPGASPPAWGRTYVFTSSSGPSTRWTSRTTDHDAPMLAYRLEVEVPRGVMIVASSLVGETRGERVLVDRRLADGWLVIWTAPPLLQLVQALDVMTPSELVARLEGDAPRRFAGAPLTARNDEDPIDAAVRALARRFDDLAAQRAYAIEAMLEELDRQHPGLADVPTVVVGMSLGALFAPAIAARLEGRVDAVVLVGGGADPFAISRDSSLGVGIGVSLHGRTATPEEVDEIVDRACQLATLHPGALAPRLRSLPTLLVQARFDRIVPSRQGDLLFERWGRPERWTLGFGHNMLFGLFLPWHAGDIAAWIDDVTAGPR